jgi:hypothetical protein
MNDDKQIRGLMIFEWVLKIGHWKSSYVSLKKGKKKIIRCAHDKKLYLFYLSHRHAILSRGTQWNRWWKCQNAQNSKSFLLVLSMLDRTYPTRSDISIGFQSLGISSRSDISDASGISGPRSGSRVITVGFGWTYPTFVGHIRLARHIQLPVGFQSHCSRVQ